MPCRAPVVVMLFLSGGCQKVPTSLQDAFALQDDLQGFQAITPLSTSSPLGYGIAGESDEGRLTLQGGRCLLLPPDSMGSGGAGSLTLEVLYRSMGDLGAELGSGGQQAEASAHKSRTARLTLRDVRVQSGLGVPDPSGPCWSLNASQQLQVITRELRAGDAILDITRDLTVDTSGDGALPGTAASLPLVGELLTDTPEIAIDAAWEKSSDGRFQASDIVLGGLLESVYLSHVQSSEPILLPIQSARTVDFPSPFSGSVTISEASGGGASLQISQVGPTIVDPSFKMPPCKVGEQMKLAAGEECYLWPGTGESGSRLLTIQWINQTIASQPHAALRMKGFITSYVPLPESPPVTKPGIHARFSEAPGGQTLSCEEGFVDNNLDLHRGDAGDGCECQIREEICDGQDNDCDWAIDEGQVCADPPVACPLQSIRVVLAEVRDCTAYVNLSADTSRLPDDFQMRIERQHPTHYDSPMILSAGSFSSGSFSFNESMNKGITPRYFMSWSACTDSAKYISPVKGEQAFGTNPCL
jgi:hypothetical protein